MNYLQRIEREEEEGFWAACGDHQFCPILLEVVDPTLATHYIEDGFIKKLPVLEYICLEKELM